MNDQTKSKDFKQLIKFAVLFAVPEFVLPHLTQLIAEREMDLVLRLAGQRCSLPEIAGRFGCAAQEIRGFVEESYVRKLLHKAEENGELVYYAADFYERLDFLCKFDSGYRTLDKALLQALDAWCFTVYEERMQPYLASLQNCAAVERAPETFELLENLGDFLNTAYDIRLVPCNCRMLAGCGRSTETCLSFNQSISERTLGRTLSKEEAWEIILKAHKNGLMHQVNSDWRANGAAWLCNCCSCCCYPTRLAQKLGTKGTFPLVQYAARRDPDRCTFCGACVKRCNFSAFYLGEVEKVRAGKVYRKVEFNPQKCWGCGLCAGVCPSNAITMEILDSSQNMASNGRGGSEVE